MKLNNNIIPISHPETNFKDYLNVNLALKRSNLSGSSPVISAFERKLEKKLKVNSAIAVANGTVALQAVLHKFGLTKGQKVLIPDLSFIAVANAVKSFGADIISVDVNYDDWQIDSNLIKEIDDPNVVGIILVHNYGGVAEIDEIRQIAEQRNWWIISDAAESHFAKFEGCNIENKLDITTTSFYANKIIAAGEGGAIYCKDLEIAENIRHIISHSQVAKGLMKHDEIGFNYRMSGLAAAYALNKIENISKLVSSRDRLHEIYIRSLQPLIEKGIVGIRIDKPNVQSVNWLFSIIINAKNVESNAYEYFLQNGIETRLLFNPLSKTRYLGITKFVTRNNNSHLLRKHGLSLPTYSSLTERNISRIVEVLSKYVEEL